MRRVWLGMPLGIALAFPGSAAAATVELETHVSHGSRGSTSTYQTATFTAAPGEANALAVRADAGRIVFHDAGAEIAPGDGCTAPEPHTAICSPTEAVVVVSVDAGDADDVVTSEVSAASGFSPNIAGGPGDDALSGDDDHQGIDGGEGDDVLRGGGGIDVLAGGVGRDRLEGGDGSDQLDGDGATAAADTISGGPGADTAFYARRTSPVRVDLGEAAPDGAPGEGDVLEGVEGVTGGLAADVLLGDEGSNTLDGSPASQRAAVGDVVGGRGGDDELEGGPGDDSLSGGRGDDSLMGWGGSDRYAGGRDDDELVLDFDNERRRTPDAVRCGGGADLVSDPSVSDVVPRGCESVELDFIGVSALRRRPYRSGRLHFEIRLAPDRNAVFGGCAVFRLGDRRGSFGRAVVQLPRRGVVRAAVPLSAAGRAAMRRRPARIPVRFANYDLCRDGRGRGFASRGGYTARL